MKENAQQRLREKPLERPTILDLAKATGFSIGSISRAFNNSPAIKGASKERILEAARRMGYRPHSGARTIKLGRSGRWGVLLPSFENPYYARLLDAFDLEARRRGASVQLGLTRYRHEAAQRIVKYWGSDETDGIIADIGVIDAATARLIAERQIPAVFLHGRPDSSFDMIDVSAMSAIERALKTLEELGHERIAYVGVQDGNPSVNGPHGVWKRWMEQRGITGAPLLRVTNNGAGGQAAWEQIRSGSWKPTAIICHNDIIACGLAYSAAREGVRVPRNFSLIGSDDIEEGQRIGLSTMRIDFAKIAGMGLNFLEHQRTDPERPAARGLIEAEFVLRDSLARCTSQEALP